MKKQYIIGIAAATLALASCSSDDVFNGITSKSDSDKITFAAPYVATSSATSADGPRKTRATGDIETSAALQEAKVKVWAEAFEGSYATAEKTTVFDGTELSYTDGQWTYGEEKAWKGDKTHDFAAFAPSSVSGVSYTNGTFNISAIPAVQLISNTAGSKAGDDYLVATTSTNKTASGTNGVDLRFNHILSRLSVYAYTSGTGYTVKLNSMKLYLPSGDVKATYTQANHGEVAGTWTWNGFTSETTADAAKASTSTYTTYTISEAVSEDLPYLVTATKSTAKHLDNEYFVAPTPSATNFYMDVDYTVTVGGVDKQITKTVKVDNLTAFKQGFKTNLFVDLNPQLITFSVTTDLDWKDADNNYVTAEGKSFILSAVAEAFHINGKINVKNNTVKGTSADAITYKATSLKKNGTGTDVLRGSQNINLDASGNFTIAASSLDLNQLESGVNYTLAVKSNQEDENVVVPVTFTFDQMSLTLKPYSGNMTFTAPVATTTPAAIAFAWGDTESSAELTGSFDASARVHTYTSTTDKTFKILSAEIDRTKQQIPEFNFGKYPAVTLGGNWDSEILATTMNANTNAHLLTNINTAILNSGATDLTGMFWDTENLSNINVNTLTLYKNATSMRAVFARKPHELETKTIAVTSLTIPSGLFDNNTKVTSFAATFAGTGVRTIPQGLFDKNTEVLDFSSVFRNCSELTSAPDGLFAKNLKAYGFSEIFYRNYKHKLNPNIFIGGTINASNRFLQAVKTVDFSNSFFNIAKDLGTAAGSAGTMPLLRDYQYNSNGYGWWYDDSYYHPYNVGLRSTLTNYNSEYDAWTADIAPTDARFKKITFIDK